MTIDEVQQLYKVVLHDSTDKVEYGTTNVGVDNAEYENYVNGAMFAAAGDQWNVAGRKNTVTVVSPDANDAADGKTDFVVNLYPAYEINARATATTGATGVAFFTATDTRQNIANGCYVAKEAKLYVWPDNKLTTLTSDVLALTREPAKDDTGIPAYSFIVKGEVKDTDIKIGTQLKVTGKWENGDADNGFVINAIKTAGKAYTVTVKTTGSTVTPTVYWSSQSDGSEVATTGAPTGVVVSGPTQVAGTNDTWTVEIANGSGAMLTATGTWYFVIEVLGIKTICELTLP